MRLAIFGVLLFIAATLLGYWHGLSQRRRRAPAPAPAPTPAPRRAPLPPPAPPPTGTELPSDDRGRADSLPPPSDPK
ncbi:MAG TPA: hypothetical protein VNI01_07690 [Elusimicrobiota bacterium]|jgi:hypothetical protein|nr:hypothetical protein [Elusimicrobiota bacterium]